MRHLDRVLGECLQQPPQQLSPHRPLLRRSNRAAYLQGYAAFADLRDPLEMGSLENLRRPLRIGRPAPTDAVNDLGGQLEVRAVDDDDVLIHAGPPTSHVRGDADLTVRDRVDDAV